MGETDKGGVGETNIQEGKKTSVEAIAYTNNDADNSSKEINWYAGLINLVFTVFATANRVDNSNLASFKKTSLAAIISIFDKFITIFAFFVNITLAKKPNIYKFNAFLFDANS